MAGVKKFLDFFVKIEPDEGGTLSDEELQKILAEEAPPAATQGPAAPARPGTNPPRAPSTNTPPRGAPPRAASPTGAPVTGPAPRPRVSEVASPVVAQVRPPPQGSPAPEELPDFPTIYRAAKVPAPAHGYDIERIATMLANPRLAGMSPSVKANSVLMALEVAGVPIDDVVADAVARDRAIDDFEAWWAAKVAQLDADKRAENATIEDEMNRYLEAQRERIRANNEAIHRAQDTFAAWKDRKRTEEQRLYDTVQPFVSENPITLNTGTVAPAGGPGSTGPARA